MHPQLQLVADEYRSAQARLHDLVRAVPDEQWGKRSDPARWSVAECVAHLNITSRSEEHTSELQSQSNLVCRLLLETNTAPTARPGGRHDRERAPRERVHRPARREPLHDLPETLWNGAQRSRPGPPALQRALHAGDD